MSSINIAMSTTIPAIALFCNLFLFSTLITAKKTNGVYTFMSMLGAFMLWTAGSLFMRMGLSPSADFWWKISLTGLFISPWTQFLVASLLAERKGSFLKVVYGLVVAVLAVLTWFDIFLTPIKVNTVGGESTVHYEATIWAIIPVLAYAVILISALVVLFNGIKKNGIPKNHITPFLFGEVAMLIGTFLDLVPALNSLPMDTLGCAVNALFMYYALYKKRVLSLHQMTSNGVMYLLTLVVVGATGAPLFRLVRTIVNNQHSDNLRVIAIIVCVVCAAAAILIYLVFIKLNDAIFIKEQNRKEDILKEFSAKVNTSLKVNDILSEFLGMVRNEIPSEHVYICRYSAENGRYESYNGIDTLELPIVILKSNPILAQLEMSDGGLLYSDFKRSTHYRSMWEEEKRTLEFLNIEFILPFMDDDEIMGFALFSNKAEEKPFTYEEINFLESVAAITSIALKNAQLYSKLEQEAQLDALTNLYNRRAFNKKLSETVDNKSMSPVSLILFNLDDFSLYNELYGNEEGDLMLQRFAGILTSVFGSKGDIARYGGKEFTVLVPHTDAATAEQYAQRVRVHLTKQIESSKENTKKFLTFSAAICTYPSVAANANELMTYVNLAIFHIKQHGKNKIEIYNKEYATDDAGKDKKEHIYELTSTIYALTAAIDAKDHYTFNHSRCVSEYATKLAEFAGLPSDYVEIIRQAGLLHDIGKISIPDAILTKTGRLTNEEFMIMRQHVERSIEMIRHLPSLDYVIPAVVGHHERYDGTGYPRGIAGEDIPIGARCLTIADAFDAMVSRRSYKDKMTVEASLTEIMVNLGKQFDPELGQLFVEKVRAGEIEVIDY